MTETPSDAAQRPLPTNSPYLLAVWAEALNSSDVIAICKFYPLVSSSGDISPSPRRRANQDSPKATRSVKVDVVSNNGERWTRLNTCALLNLSKAVSNFPSRFMMRPPPTFSMTSDRLLRELYELDLAGSSDSDSSNPINDQDAPLKKSKLYQAGQDLRDAARAQINPPSEICIRFTRLLPHLGLSDLTQLVDIESGATKLSKDDQLIVAQLRRLADLGIRVKLGPAPHTPRQPVPSVQAPERILIPTNDINLDLSLLIALCSDITHASLPDSASDALKRFRTLSRRQRQAMNGKQHKDGTDKSGNHTPTPAVECEPQDEMDTAPDADAEVNIGLSEHARSLVAQTMQESRNSLIDEIYCRCYYPTTAHFGLSIRESEYSTPDHMVQFRFWTTREAKDRFFAIVDKIGGPAEKLRARALFREELAVNFWESSRYPLKYIPDLVPIRLHEEHTISEPPPTSRLNTPFQTRLRETCTDLLSSRISPITSSPSPTNTTTPPNTSERTPPLPPTPRLIPASALKIGPSVRSGITPHTLRSLLIGAGASDSSAMITTLTANRSSIDTVLRRIKVLFPAPPMETRAISVHAKNIRQTGALGATTIQPAAIWIVEPRSLAEGMRAKSSGHVHHLAQSMARNAPGGGAPLDHLCPALRQEN